MEKDWSWVSQILISNWNSTEVITRGRRHQAGRLPGFIAYYDHKPSGLLTYHIEREECEIISLNSKLEGIGVGTALKKIISLAKGMSLKRLWVITSNDNIHSIRFYQKRGFHLIAVHPNAVNGSRKLKPNIPHIDIEEIPIQDEVGFEILLKK